MSLNPARRLACFAASLAAAVASPAFAGDGRLEINQACAATGCFAADAPGFPVTTQANQSYVLTSTLTLSDANTTAIQLAENAALDMNGFSIVGVASCSASPTTCTNTGTGDGINGSGGAQVRNGTILKMGDDGIVGAGMLVDGVRIEQCGGQGISGGNGAAAWIVRNSRIQVNGSHGVDFPFGAGSDGAIVERNVIRRNGGDGVRGEDLTVLGNAVNGNDGMGLALSFISSDSGYGDNVINDNNGGNANPQVSGGVQIGTNVCGGDATCP